MKKEIEGLKLSLLKKRLELKVLKQVPKIHEYKLLKKTIAKKMQQEKNNE